MGPSKVEVYIGRWRQNDMSGTVMLSIRGERSPDYIPTVEGS